MHMPEYRGLKDTQKPPRISGQHQLYGDGSVVWVSAKGKDLSQLPHPNDTFGKVTGYGDEGYFYFTRR
jgi:hypothetical protein